MYTTWSNQFTLLSLLQCTSTDKASYIQIPSSWKLKHKAPCYCKARNHKDKVIPRHTHDRSLQSFRGPRSPGHWDCICMVLLMRWMLVHDDTTCVWRNPFALKFIIILRSLKNQSWLVMHDTFQTKWHEATSYKHSLQSHFHRMTWNLTVKG